MKLYKAIAQNAHLLASDNALVQEYADLRQKRIVYALPSGSGFDAGTKIESADAKSIVISTSFHCMDENGCYDGWEDYTVTVTADLALGFSFEIDGDDRDGLIDYVADVMHAALDSDFDWIA